VRVAVGLDTYSYHTAASIWPPSPPEPLELPDYLERASELGLDGVASADMGHFDSTGPGYLGELKSKADELGLYLEIGTGGTDPEHLDEAARASELFGQPVVRTFVSAGSTWGGDFRAQLPSIARELTQAAGLAARHGVTLAVENHQDLTSEELEALVMAVGPERLGVCLDTGNSLGVLEHPLDAARRLAPYTRTVHLKDYCVAPFGDGYVLVGCPLGKGSVPLEEIVALLREHSPAGELHLNIESALEFVPVSSMRGERWTERHAGKAGAILSAGLRAFSIEELSSEKWFCRPDTGPSIDELLAAEEVIVRGSVARARELAGGASA